MTSLLPRSIRSVLVAGAAAMLLSCASPPPDASAVLTRSSQAMGATQLNTLRYTAEGTGYTFGQAYKPGGAWPKITLHSLTRSVDYGTATMRDEVVLSRAEPLGGGGYPLTGQQRTEQLFALVRTQFLLVQRHDDAKAAPVRHRIAVGSQGAAHLSEEAAQTIADAGFGFVGLDFQTEKPGERNFVVHKALLSRGVLLCEYLVNLHRLGPDSIFIATPLSIRDVEASPTRAIALNFY